jgi:hypothetical protein
MEPRNQKRMEARFSMMVLRYLVLAHSPRIRPHHHAEVHLVCLTATRLHEDGGPQASNPMQLDCVGAVEEDQCEASKLKSLQQEKV